MIKPICSSCGKMKSKFIKKGGSIDIHKAMLPLLPKKGLTLMIIVMILTQINMTVIRKCYLI